ncbi:unnamed protein product [Ostreobium quekettii]|uniref:V-SNARE coiled-coil homology domain-containing protein n=1 Tax=Ostreobium quekettii TaxID=121088 RepID=A0A8S1JDX9_9CHLO|nr:unnamed protein product [Ostreobium quekettii]
MKRIKKKVVANQPARQLAEGPGPRLPVAPRLVAHSGIPSTADALAYEAVQRLLAVGTLDGRIKLLGGSGVESLLFCKDRQPTQQLLFLTNRGGLLRLSKLGSIELWSLCSGRPLGSIDLDDEGGASCICAMPREPYLLIGCKNGDLRFGRFLDSSGEPINEGREVMGMDMLTYKVSRLKFKAVGEMINISVAPSDEDPLLLALHSGSGATIWDMRAQRPIIRVVQAKGADTLLARAGPLTTACWVTAQHCPSLFATGHESGDILVWSIPEPSMRVFGGAPQLVAHLRVALGSATARPIMGLSFVSGPQGSLVVFGGQSKEQPDTLTLIQLPRQLSPQQESTDGTDVECTEGGISMPWSGNICGWGWALVPPEGSLHGNDDPAAILILTEGGHLVLQDLQTFNPIAFTLPLQSLPPVTVTVLTEMPGLATSCSTGIPELRHLPNALASGAEFGGVLHPDWDWVISGGDAPDSSEWSFASSPVYLSAHEDGRIRFWDLFGEAPEWLATVPSAHVEKELSWQYKGVSAMKMSSSGDLLAVGHVDGEVEVYQFCGIKRRVGVRMCSSKAIEDQDTVELEQPPGYQLMLRVDAHTTAITCLSFEGSCSLLAVGDDSGHVSVVDMAAPRVGFLLQLSECGLHAVAFGEGPWSQDSERCQLGMVLYVVDAESSLAAIDLENGQLVGHKGWLRPKNASKVLCLSLLDVGARPVAPSTGRVVIPWLLHPKQSKDCVESLDAHTATSQENESATGQSGGASERLPQAKTDTPLGEGDGIGSNCQDGQQSEDENVDPPPDEDDDETGDILAAAVAKLQVEEKMQHQHQASQSWLGQKIVGNIGKGVAGMGKGVADVKRKVIRKGKAGVPGQKAMTQAPPAGSQSMAAASSSGQDRRVQSLRISCQEDGESPRMEVEILPPETDAAEVPQEALTTADDESAEVVEATVGYVLIATDQYLRLYSPDAIVSGERTTINRTTFSTPIIFAASCETQELGAGGVVCITQDYSIQVYNLPNLDLCYEIDILDVLGWSWNCFALQDHGTKFAAGQDGNLAFVSSCGELVRIALFGEGAPSVLAPKQVYDWELAAAVHYARNASQQRADRMEASKCSGTGDKSTGMMQAASLGQEFRKGLDVLVSAAKHATGELNKAVGTMAKGAGGEAPPDLPTLFHSQHSRPHEAAAEHSGHREFDSTSGGESSSAAAMAAVAGNSATAPNRADLFQGAHGFSNPSTEPRLRTADEIKAAYGRARTPARETTKSIMQENMSRLHERGEKLRGLEERTADLENDARGFASMAKELVEKQKRRRWWQL